jgi:hypothetical protein
MEARRTFQGSSYRQLWIILAALMVAAVLGVGGAFVVSGLTSSGKAPQVVTHAASGTVLNQDDYRNVAPGGKAPSKYIPGRTDF